MYEKTKQVYIKRHATSEKQQARSDMQQAKSNKREATCNKKRHATSELQFRPLQYLELSHKSSKLDDFQVQHI